MVAPRGIEGSESTWTPNLGRQGVVGVGGERASLANSDASGVNVEMWPYF
ncbi:hypothetical protein [Nocardia jinanensis]|uniref:Uncharacterized protein n=1 Tax=Nocardia jinanensis TaxID=382504 RepID=A0A917VZ31_9NOCA|nr:hypothetical protein [Nocardia jinanensis]GGL47429.1 hypothetical protein GCM10011588_72910 [Nocardia jinanensis]